MGQKDRTLQNGRAEIHGLAVFHELLEQPQDLLIHWRASSCCKAAKILRSDCRCPLRFIILVGNVSSVIDNFMQQIYNTNLSCNLFSYKQKNGSTRSVPPLFMDCNVSSFCNYNFQERTETPINSFHVGCMPHAFCA